MSRPTVSTGNILFDSREKNDRRPTDPADPMHIVLLGDFTARANNGRLDAAGIGERRLIEIDRDNFDEVFCSLAVQLLLPVAEAPLIFSEFDDLHPDFLYDRLPLFDELRGLQRRLMNPEQFAPAAAQIRGWRDHRDDIADTQPIPSPVAESDSGLRRPGDPLEAVLSASSEAAYRHSATDGIDRLIRDIVAPYLSAKADPQLPELLSAVAEAGCELMRKISHASAFQQLEASWRSVYLLVRRLETGSRLKLFLLDVAREELLEDIANCQGQIEHSGLHQRLVDKMAIPGAKTPALINADYYITDRDEDIELVSALGSIGEAAGAAVVCGARTTLAGCEDISQSADPTDWIYPLSAEHSARWEELRKQHQSRWIALAVPRFLLRLPYAKQTSPVESFDYSELPANGAHRYYLWGNSAYLLTLLLASSFSAYGWSFRVGQIQLLEDFPLHVYTDDDGEIATKPCAEAMLTDSAARRLTAAGLQPVRSVKGAADIMIPQINALAGSALCGPWLD